MGQIISWFRGSPPRDEPGLRDVSVEESHPRSSPAEAPVSHFEKSSSGSNMASKTTGSDVAASKTDPAAPNMTLLAPKGWSKTTATTSVKVDPVTTKLSTGPTKTSSSTTTTAAASAAAAKAQQKTTATTSVKVDPVTTKLSTGPTKTSSSTTTTATAAAAASTSAAKAQQKIQVEVPPKAPETKQAPSTPQTSSSVPPLDPLDALGSLLPTEAPKRPEPKFTGPEVTENVTSEEGVRVGEREDTLPPGYRLQDMPPVPADSKPAEVPKPMSTADALDVLSMGFMDTPPKKSVETISTASTAAANFAPAPAKKSDPAAPPADKKAKMDIDSFSLNAAVPADKVPLDSKVLVSAPKATVESSKAQSAASPTALSLDALCALGDLLPEAEAPKPEAPVRPEDLVSEITVEEEEGVRVGEREDTLPPEYRLKPGEKEAIQPPPQTSLDSDQALDFLCGDFSSPAPAQDKKPRMETDGFSLDAGLTAPSTQASVPPVESLSALDSLSLDFVSSSASTTVKAAAPQKVESAAVPPLKKESKSTKSETKPETKAAATDAIDSRPAPDPALSLDALSALGDLLPEAEAPKPEAPVRPEDLVLEITVEEEEGVRVGEREDTLPPEYRLKPGEKEAIQPPPQTSLDPDQALDFLCGDFSSSSAAPTQSAAPAQISADAAMNALSLDFVAPSSASQQSSECPPQAPLSPGADLALDALSDSLKDIAPTPQPEPPLPQNIIKEKEIEEERLIKMGERDDTLPPEFRPTEDELRKMEEDKNKVPEAPAEKPMDDKTALDLLAGDFSAPATAPATSSSSSATVTSSSSAKVCATPSDPTQPMSGKVLDSLYDSLLPDTPQFTQFKDTTKKSPAEGTVEPLPAAPSSDVTPTNKS